MACQIPCRLGWPKGVRGARNAAGGACAAAVESEPHRMLGVMIETIQRSDLRVIDAYLPGSRAPGTASGFWANMLNTCFGASSGFPSRTRRLTPDAHIVVVPSFAA